MESAPPRHRPTRVSTALAQHGVFVASAASALAVLVGFAWPMLFGKVHVGTDLGDLHIPLRWLFAEALDQGRVLLWNPYEYTGFYLHGEGQTVMSHPLNILQFKYLPFTWAFNLEHLRNYIFSLLGMYLFLRRHEVRREGAVLGAILFAFSSFNLFHYMHMNFVAIASHIPWLLLAEDYVVRSASRWKAAIAWAAFSLLTSSQHLHAHPQVTWMSMVVLGFYALYLVGPSLVGARRDPPMIGAVWRLLALALAIGLGFLSGAVQLLPMWETLQTSSRADPSYLFLGMLTLNPLDLMQLVAPYLLKERTVGPSLTEYTLYSGSVMPVLVTWLVMRRRQFGEPWKLARAAMLLSVIALLLTMGDRGLLHRIEAQLPVVGLFRAPVRYIMVAQLGFAVASAIAFADLLAVSEGRRDGPSRWWPLAVAPALSIAVTAAALIIDPRVGPIRLFDPASPAMIALGPCLSALAAFLVFAGARRSRTACAALVVLAAADVGAYGLSYIFTEPTAVVEEWRDELELPAKMATQRLQQGDLRLMMRGVRFGDGYAAMVPARVLPVERKLKPSNISWRSFRAALRVSSIGRVFRSSTKPPLPRVRMVSRARPSEDILTDLAKINPELVALVPQKLPLVLGPRGRAEIIHEHPGEIRIKTQAETRQLLIVGESHHSGWVASIDGEPCDIVRVYGDYMGCVVEQGEHEALFEFSPASYRVGKQLSGLGLGLTALLPALFLIAGRGRSSEQSEPRVVP